MEDAEDSLLAVAAAGDGDNCAAAAGSASGSKRARAKVDAVDEGSGGWGDSPLLTDGDLLRHGLADEADDEADDEA
jgi:hypothetical protein